MNRTQICAATFAIFYGLYGATPASAYSFNEIVPDVRQPASVSGGSSCPVRAHHLTTPGSTSLRWSTALNASPSSIITQEQTAPGRLNEIEQVITQSLAVWTGVTGTTLTSFGALSRTNVAAACGSDGINSICLNQPDGAFTPGVLAFTRVITADRIGAQVGNSPPASEVGQILDADIYFNPSDWRTTFATPAALAASPTSYDLSSLLSHELGHFLGFSHSAVWSALMYPFAPPPGAFSGLRPTLQQPDAPLGEDDRAGLRVLYPSAADVAHTGAIFGKVTPANPISLPLLPPGVTGVFGAHVVAVDATTGAVVASTLGGWSCSNAGPPQFDGSYKIERLPTGHSYTVYAEPLNGTVAPAQVYNALGTLCRNATTDAGWPPLQGCVVPEAVTSFTTRLRPAP